ncbi:hypothetical protein IV203_015619 [Nitzschia inconspicua]|uniref:Glycosyltransferase family 92 protein n=1 Tax=Nitzschia inconspicua TaxID=303405 RepID=A0A9K3LB05_9STRA|nr:hypothetical protein IV203_015619 [Nitzschia inconspicua]
MSTVSKSFGEIGTPSGRSSSGHGLFNRVNRKLISTATLNSLLLLVIVTVAIQITWLTPTLMILEGSSSCLKGGPHLYRYIQSQHSSPYDVFDNKENGFVRWSKSKSPDDRYFSACMVTMDDNHFWKEFLAYHYTFLNLRRLIVAVDPRSKTSPSRIFKQWEGLINITQWADEDFIFDCEEYEDDLTDVHRCRQRRLYQMCSEALKKEKTTTWVAYIDVDEYIVPNWRAGPYERIQIYDRRMNIFDIFDANPFLNDDFNYTCYPMSRVPVNIKESSPKEVYKDVPAGINATSLMTLRYRHLEFNEEPLPGKCMVHLSEIDWSEIKDENHNTHRPFKSQCAEQDMWMSPWDSAFLTHHYPGSLEAFQFRDDPRKEERRTAAHYYEKHNGTRGVVPDDSARFWISNFVDKVGLQRAQKLLKGADLVGLED